MPQKLTPAQIDEIRRRYAAGGISQAALGREFGVSRARVQQLCSTITPGDGPQQDAVLSAAHAVEDQIHAIFIDRVAQEMAYWKVTELAAALGQADRTAVDRLLRGREPSLGRAVHLAKVLGISLDAVADDPSIDWKKLSEATGGRFDPQTFGTARSHRQGSSPPDGAE